MKRKLLLFVAIICFSVGNMHGQSVIKGIVVDAQSGETLPGASILLDDGSKGTISDFKGNFELNVNQGKHSLKLSFVGYIDQVKDVNATGSLVDLGEIALQSNTLGLSEVLITSSFVVDRRTPVPVSTIQPTLIDEKLGTQEFPEILKSTPSVYTTKTGGGFGDGRINVRGFDSNNFGVLINGVPVNDMENGKVYWSNWAGLADVTQSMQVQRGLGASRLALSSVGGTMNMVTRSTDAEKGGSAYVGYGTAGYLKKSFNLSTGLTSNNWAITLLGTQTSGDGYIVGTNFNSYTYFLNVSKIINDKHRLSFTAFGAPQWHNQRGISSTIETYRDHKDGSRYNPFVGIRNGEWYGGAYGYNKYHKPQLSLNHYWKMDEQTMLSTSVYASISQGGGRRIEGDYSNDAYKTADGYVNFDAMEQENIGNPNGSQLVESFSVNQHNWYGVLSTLNKGYGDFNFTGGLDARYYNAEHYKEISDLYGGDFYLNNSNKNRSPGTHLTTGDKIAYNNDAVVVWTGLFGQAEYTQEKYTAFLTATISNQSYQRIEYFLETPDNKNSDWVNFLPWSVKAGASYLFTNQHKVFLNGGYFTRSPYFSNVFLNYTNTVNDESKMEKVLNFDLGYSYSSRTLKVDLTGYYANWMDKGKVVSFQGATANIPGINALHYGAELEATYKPYKHLDIKGMFSWGDWTWQDDVEFSLYDDNNVYQGKYNAYIGGTHVGNAAQITASIGLDYEVLNDVKLGADINYYGKNFADFDPTNRTTAPADGVNVDSWQMPDYTTIDLNLRWNFKMGNLNSTLYGRVNNLLNTEYIGDARDGADHSAGTAEVYYGFGTTWSTGVKVKF